MTDDPRILLRVLGASSHWESPETVAYDNEAHLQALLVEDPSRIPGVTEGAMAVDELPTKGGPVDVCIVDIDGSLTVVECKLASNSERRRMVVGQVIDYAAAIWSEGGSSFLAAWERRGGPDLAESLGSNEFERLKQNIAEARISLCLAVDRIDNDLRRLVEYLNRVTSEHIRVTALQLAYARHRDIEILIPSTYGDEIANAKTRTTKIPWTRETFLDALASPRDRELAEWYFGRTEATANEGTDREPLWYGTRPGGGIFLHPGGLRYAPLQLWLNASGHLMLFGNWKNYQEVTAHEGFAELAQLLGQDHRGGSQSVRADRLDRQAVWDVATRCADAINQPSV